jgi:hypothetical protein
MPDMQAELAVVFPIRPGLSSIEPASLSPLPKKSA